MRSFVRAGIVLLVGVAACNKDSSAPVDFENPAAVSSNLSSVDSAFDSDVFRSFNTATFMLDAAAPSALRPAATVLATLQPKLQRAGRSAYQPGVRHAQRMQALAPQLSVSAQQGAIIPDSMYGRVFVWNDTTDQYVFRGTTVSNLNGVRFLLYAVDLGGAVVEPVVQIGTLDIIDESTQSSLKLHVLVRNTAGTTTYVDYTAELLTNQATASGSITNGRAAPNNKTLSFVETLTATQTGARLTATFALNDPAVTVILNESVSIDDPNLIINADFRVIRNNQTVRTVGRIIVNLTTQEVLVDIDVYLDGHPVASITGDPSLPGTLWVDAGGNPLTIEDIDALDDLFAGLQRFDEAVSGLFSPIGTLGTL